MAFQSTTGLGVAAKIAVTGNELPLSSKPGYNNVTLSLSGANGVPTTFQLNPVLEDAAGNPVNLGTSYVLSAVAAGSSNLGAAGNYALLAYSGITNTGSTVVTGGVIGSAPTASITGFPPGVATVDNTDAGTAQTALAAAITAYQNLLPTALTLTAAANASAGTTVYTGTITGGGSNALAGITYAVTGFATSANNGTFICTASSTTTLTLANTGGVAETHSGSATIEALSNLSVEGNGSTASTYLPGNYFSVAASSLTMPSGIILDAQGNTNAVFVFVAGSTINLASGQSIQLVNGAQAGNVYFVAGSSFTSVATSTVNGNILAAVSITLGGGTLNGRALANTGAVTISTATAVTVPVLSGGTAVYTGTFTGATTGSLVGKTFTVAGFVNGVNNGVFVATANSGTTTLTLSNPFAIAETHAGTAQSQEGSTNITYVAYPAKTLTGNTYQPSGTSSAVATVSATGLITAVKPGGVEVEVSFPTFNNAIGDIVSSGNPMNGLPINKIFTSVNVQVLP